MLPERPYQKYKDTLSNLKRQIAIGLDRDGEISHITRGEWHCSTCGEMGSPPPTLVEHYDEEHSGWRSDDWWDEA